MRDRPNLLLVSAVPAALRANLAERYILHEDPQTAPGSVEALVGGGMSRVDAALMARFAQLKVIAVHGVGHDQIDVAEAKRRGVAVALTTDVLTEDVADLAVALLLAVHRRVPANHRVVAEGGWRTRLGSRASGRTMGVFGMGKIGQAIATRVAPFAKAVCYSTRTPRPDLPWRAYPTLEALAEACDTLFVAVAAGPQTHHAVNANVLAKLGPRGVLVNTARGSVVDEAALVAALQAGRLAGAGLDVFADEPLVPKALREAEQVVLAPHQGSGTVECRAEMAAAVLANLHRYLA